MSGHQWRGDDEGGGRENGTPDTSTLYITGFPENALDRELENYARFLPGYCGAKASMKTWPKVWVRFDTKENAVAALVCIDGQPFDVQDAESPMLRASIARTDMNPVPPERLQPRSNGPLSVKGYINQLIGFASANSSEPQWSSINSSSAAATIATAVGGMGRSTWSAPSRALVKPPSSSANEQDTLFIFGAGDSEMSQQVFEDFFSAVDGFVALKFTPASKAGGNCFVKFASHRLADAALQHAAASGFDAQFARTNLNLSLLGAPPDAAASGPISPVESPRWSQPMKLPALQRQAMVIEPRRAASSALWEPEPKRAKFGGKGASAPVDSQVDTLIVMSVPDDQQESLSSYFQQVEGFVALRYSASKFPGVNGNCFVKFRSAEIAEEARGPLSEELSLEVQVARSNLNPSQATVVADDVVV